jgi:hypothetical protein
VGTHGFVPAASRHRHAQARLQPGGALGQVARGDDEMIEANAHMGIIRP